jgi:hypothetical protein
VLSTHVAIVVKVAVSKLAGEYTMMITLEDKEVAT